MSDLFKTIVADPPWPQSLTGGFKRRKNRATQLPYGVMSVDDIAAIPIADISDNGAHLWLWTTNQFIEDGFRVMRAWGFKYLAPITWVKPSGLGAWFAHTTQTILFGYKSPLKMKGRYKPTAFTANAGRHSSKPEKSYQFIEAVSEPPYLELFARNKRDGWASWGNEVVSDISL